MNAAGAVVRNPSRPGARRLAAEASTLAERLPELRCGLCGGGIPAKGPFFRASGDFLPRGDPLATYCNAPLHWECYARWPQRPKFAQHFVDAWVKANRKNPFWWAVYQDEAVYISVNPLRSVEEASLRLYALGNDIRVRLADWVRWLADVRSVTPNLQPCELEALAEVLPRLRQRFPTDHALVDAIDPAEKRPRSASA